MRPRGSAAAGAGVTWELGVSVPWAHHVELYRKSRLPLRPSGRGRSRQQHSPAVKVALAGWPNSAPISCKVSAVIASPGSAPGRFVANSSGLMDFGSQSLERGLCRQHVYRPVN